MTDGRLADIANVASSEGVAEAWEGVAEADRVPPNLRTDAPDRGYSRLAGPVVLRGAVRHLYAIRLAGRDPERYRQITKVGLRFTVDTLHRGEFDAYVAWLDDLELRYPGRLDVIVAAYRGASAREPGWTPTFDEVLRAYDELAAQTSG